MKKRGKSNDSKSVKQKKKSVIHCDYVIERMERSKIREQLGIKTEGRGTLVALYEYLFWADLMSLYKEMHSVFRW